MLAASLHKAAIAIAFVLLTAWLLFGFGFAAWRSSFPPPNRAQDAQDNQATEATKHIGAPSSAEERFAYYTLALAWLTGVLAVSTLGLWIATILTLRHNRQVFEHTFRARVSIFDVAIEHGNDRPNISLAFRLENAGGVPATGLMIGFLISAGPEGHPPTRDDFYTAPQREEISLILAAKESVQKQGAIRDFSAEDYRKAREHGVPHYLRFGIAVAYRDGFGCERITWKWFEWNSDSGAFRECAARQD
jgi:hypothetical protein